MQYILFIVILFNYLSVHATSSENTYGPIRGRDRLWDIATRVRPEPTITRYQAIMALLRANPHAFNIPCNINSLKISQILRIPSASEMKQLSPDQAETEYHRQNNLWKAYRNQGQVIHCSPEEQKSLALQEEPAEPILSVIKSALTPITSSLPLETPPPVSPKPTPQAIPSPLKENEEQQIGSIILSFPLLIALIVFFTTFLIGWFIHQHIVAKILTKQNRLDSLKNSIHQQKTNLKKNDELGNIVSDVPFAEFDEEKISPSFKTDNIGTETLKEKLAYVRTYLADGEGKAVERFLKEVVEEGTPEQREEAKQLIEISKKMSTLELYVAKNQSLVAHNPLLQEILQVTRHLPTLQYLPENEGKIIDLVDKIFEFLDRELDAQGKLMESYTHRYKPKFFEAKYNVVKKNEQILTEEELSQVESRLAPKPPRFL